jgi:predicted O-linked N-acetylglucosamine transferase (SPINDLY family)
LGIDSGIPVILCPGVPFKYAPQHDRVLVEIARSLGRCQLVLFTHGLRGLSEKLNRRLEVSFATANMDSKDYLKFIPWQDKASFYGLMKHADIFLDTIGFSGFNTAMQAVECGLPIVTREGQFMRGRLASGILRRIGLTELIAGTEEEYVNLAVKLVREAEYRQGVHHRIEMSRDVLFDDVAPVRALEDFLIKAVKHRM